MFIVAVQRLKHFGHALTMDFRRKVLEPNFRGVYYDKPEGSRSESTEGYWVCKGWKPQANYRT